MPFPNGEALNGLYGDPERPVRRCACLGMDRHARENAIPSAMTDAL